MKVIFGINNIFRWLDTIDKTIKDYNNLTHRTIGMKHVEYKDNEKSLLETVFSRYILPDFLITELGL